MGWRERAVPVETPSTGGGGWRSRAVPVVTELPPEEPSRAAAALAGVQNLGSFGFGDELGAGLQAGLSKLTGTGDFGDTYRRARDENRAESKAAKEAHPGYYYGAGLPAGVASAVALPAFRAAQGAGMLARAAAGAATGAGYGALAGAGESESDTAGGVAGDTVIGAGLGGALGGALPVAGAAVRGAVRGVVRPAAAVEQLRRLGVDVDQLSLGQMNPRGIFGQLEEAGQNAAGSGATISARREAGNQAWRDAALARGTAPYRPLSGGTDTGDRLGEAYRGFGPAYESIGAHPITTAGPGKQSVSDQLRSSFRRVAADEGVLATDAERASLAKYLDNQASALHYEPGQPGRVGDLQAVRHNIRQELAEFLSGANPDARGRLLANAEGEVTQQIEQNLPAHARDSLRATDARYAAHKTIENAVRRAGDQPGGLMPQHLSGAIKEGAERAAYARGAGGDLRDLAVAGREVLQSKTPPTGVRNLIEAFPSSRHIQAPFTALANAGPVKRALLGQTGLQRQLQSLEGLLRDGGAALGKFGPYLAAQFQRNPEHALAIDLALTSENPKYAARKRELQGGGP